LKKILEPLIGGDPWDRSISASQGTCWKIKAERVPQGVFQSLGLATQTGTGDAQ